jgi:hypothetical protein
MASKPVMVHPVKSSNIEAIGHDPETQTLHVHFKGGGAYHYSDVPAPKYQALMDAPSKGSHFAQHIRGKHRAEKKS